MAGVSGVKSKFEKWFRMYIHVNQIQEVYALGFPVKSPEPDYILVDQLRFENTCLWCPGLNAPLRYDHLNVETMH